MFQPSESDGLAFWPRRPLRGLGRVFLKELYLRQSWTATLNKVQAGAALLSAGSDRIGRDGQPATQPVVVGGDGLLSG